MTTALDRLAEEVAKGPGGSGLPWAETEMKNVGDTVAGTVIGVDFRQAINPETKQGATWERSGEPIMEVVIQVSGTGKFRPDLEDGDNGDRAFHIRWAFENKDAFIEAMTAAGVKTPVLGGRFAGQLVGLKQNGGVRKPTKLYKYEYVAPPSALEQAVAGEAPAATEPAQPAAPQSMLAAQPPAPAQAPAGPLVPPMSGMTAAQPPAAPPVQAPAPAPAAAAVADPQAMLTQVKTLIGMGLTNDQIAGIVGAPAEAINAVRALP